MLTVEKEVSKMTKKFEVRERSPYPDTFDAGWRKIGRVLAAICQIFPPGRSPII
jgi:hypothetical protein